MNWHLGTMGFSYKEWNGTFYPEGLQARDYLGYYSQIFDSVELDSTFYGTPRPQYVERWAAITPEEFTFCVKTPQIITHEHRLTEEAVAEMQEFLKVISLLGHKLGVILIQLPPDMNFDFIHKLAVFLRQLPQVYRYAVEFRHASWHQTATGQLLQNHRIGWASTDYIHLPRRVYVTTDFIYIRWIGRHGQYETKDHEISDMTPRLKQWSDDIQSRKEGIHDIYGYFNNDYAGHSPATCNRFKEIAGLPTTRRMPPQQPSLFD